MTSKGMWAAYGTVSERDAEIIKSADIAKAKKEEGERLKMQTVLFTVLATFACGGIVYGWAPLQVMLEDAGAFTEACGDSECETGDSLALVYALAAGALEFNGFFAGIFLDEVGPAKAISVLSVLMTLALATVALFPVIGSVFLFPGFILCGLTGIGILLVAFSATGLVPPQYANYTIMFATCFFDSSTVVPLVLSKLQSLSGLSFAAVFGTYAVFCALLLAAASIGWHRCIAGGHFNFGPLPAADHGKVSRHSSGSGGGRDDDAATVGISSLASSLSPEVGAGDSGDGGGGGFPVASEAPEPSKGSGGAAAAASESLATAVPSYGRRASFTAVAAVAAAIDERDVDVGSGCGIGGGTGGADGGPTPGGSPQVLTAASGLGSGGVGGRARRVSIIEDLPVAHLPLAAQVVSLEFVLSLLFYLVQVLKANSYIGYLDEYLRDIGAPSDNSYENAIGGLIALGFLWVPFVDFVVARTGLGWTAQLMNALSVGYLAFLMTDKLWAQWPGVWIYGLYRAFVFGFPPLLALEVFGPQTFGRISGLLFTAGGVPTLLAYPITAWGKSGAYGGWRGVNGMLIATTVLGVIPAAWLQWHSVEVAFRPPGAPVPSKQSAKKSGDHDGNGDAGVGGGGGSGGAYIHLAPLFPLGEGDSTAAVHKTEAEAAEAVADAMVGLGDVRKKKPRRGSQVLGSVFKRLSGKRMMGGTEPFLP